MTTERRKVRQITNDRDRSESNFYSPPGSDGFFETEDSDENTTTNLTISTQPHPPANVYNRNANQTNHRFISQPTRRRRAGSSHSHTKSPNSRIRHRRGGNPNSYNLPQNHTSHPITHQEPTFSTTLSDLIRLIFVFASGCLRYLRLCAPKFFRNLAVAVVLAIIIFITLMVIIIFRFLHLEVTPLCTPPSWEQTEVSQHPPLVEYYVHGRGNGHYARSVAIVEQLLAKGIDVRMFIGRATMWRAVNAAHGGDNTNFDSMSEDDVDKNSQERNGKDKERNIPTRGQVTVTSIPSILPSLPMMDCLSLLIERILSDCEIAKNTHRYPLLVISDGELPGMLRAQMGSIPSVSVAHGQTFVIGQKPSWVTNDAVLSAAWKKQRTLNSRTSYDANWIIATNFVDIPVNGGNGVIARSPMRPEVLRMGNERQARKKQIKYMDESGDVLSRQDKIGVKNSFMSPWQQDKINQLLLGKDNTEALEVVRRAIEKKQIEAFETTDLKLIRRKLVICYFRDKNGDLLTNALLRSGFDVLLFERGYHKGLSDVDDEKKFGQDLMVHRSPSAHTAEIDEDVSLMDHWVTILAQNNRRLLNENTKTGDIGIDEKTHSSSDINATGKIDSGAATEKTPNLQDSVETATNLLKSEIDAPRIIRVTDMSLFVPLLSIADGVASSAGSQLLSECIYSHLNVLALHQSDDTEQRLNIAFTKHRFDRLSKEGSLGTLNGVSMDYYANENVVHGMSLEKFSNVFDSISRHKKNKDEFETILTDTEEAMLLRTPESRKTYEDFRAYVKAVRQSPISWSYYHDLFHGIVASNNEAADILDGKEDTLAKEGERNEYIDPFQGMPEAAGVIMEIIDDLTKKLQSKTQPQL